MDITQLGRPMPNGLPLRVALKGRTECPFPGMPGVITFTPSDVLWMVQATLPVIDTQQRVLFLKHPTDHNRIVPMAVEHPDGKCWNASCRLLWRDCCVVGAHHHSPWQA